MPEITGSITLLETAPRSTLLTIPLEIRLQIYHYVLLSNPVGHPHLAPLTVPINSSKTNAEPFHNTMFRPAAISLPKFEGKGKGEPGNKTILTKQEFGEPEPQLINSLYPISPPTTLATGISFPPHVRGKIPTALLISCKQVFDETKMIPWERNTFTFVNWFWSGVYAARQFTRSLRPWQSDAMRYVGVEVLGRDLWVGGMDRLGGGIGGQSTATSTGGFGGKEGKGVGEWRELCGYWSGVWGLRLGLKGSMFSDRKEEIDGSSGWNGEDGQLTGSEKTCILDVEHEWVVSGLLKLTSLRWFEVEIEDDAVSRDTKLIFCSKLESALNSPSRRKARKDGWEGDVKVIFVERVKEEKKEPEPKDFTWYGGEPGDDSIWGLDM
ncbi:hypothetical protein EG329_012638 [Mollisiaceae sp. DMI_Dod_QoI]|nr:hypothetical protein EG329_012638 [Helotiales sp. DMI_Dod_QoI]